MHCSTSAFLSCLLLLFWCIDFRYGRCIDFRYDYKRQLVFSLPNPYEFRKLWLLQQRQVLFSVTVSGMLHFVVYFMTNSFLIHKLNGQCPISRATVFPKIQPIFTRNYYTSAAIKIYQMIFPLFLSKGDPTTRILFYKFPMCKMWKVVVFGITIVISKTTCSPQKHVSSNWLCPESKLETQNLEMALEDSFLRQSGRAV